MKINGIQIHMQINVLPQVPNKLYIELNKNYHLCFGFQLSETRRGHQISSGISMWKFE